jgi:hypothetical protein
LCCERSPLFIAAPRIFRSTIHASPQPCSGILTHRPCGCRAPRCRRARRPPLAKSWRPSRWVCLAGTSSPLQPPGLHSLGRPRSTLAATAAVCTNCLSPAHTCFGFCAGPGGVVHTLGPRPPPHLQGHPGNAAGGGRRAHGGHRAAHACRRRCRAVLTALRMRQLFKHRTSKHPRTRLLCVSTLT